MRQAGAQVAAGLQADAQPRIHLAVRRRKHQIAAEGSADRLHKDIVGGRYLLEGQVIPAADEVSAADEVHDPGFEVAVGQ